MSFNITSHDRCIMSPGELSHCTDGYKFNRECKLEECKTEIWTNREKHYFCSDDHRDEYWKRRRSKSIRLESRIRELEKRVSDLEDR